ncbi:MAG TPA: hypothetical protein VIU93_06160 [Gallionellaceae bacterium]
MIQEENTPIYPCMTEEGYTATVDYEHIDVALKSFWLPFNELVSEMDSFVPRPLSDFADKQNALSAHLRGMNPNMSDETANEEARRLVASSESGDWQFWRLFSARLMTMHVTVTLLSQALCEAEINAILATGLHEKGLAKRFEKIERDSLKIKWLKHPKIFAPEYELKEDSALFETLSHLISQRNAWMHHKIQLRVGEKEILEGSKLKRLSYQENVYWIKRYFSLPYDLAAHMLAQSRQMTAFLICYNRSPIPVAEAHSEQAS